MLSSRYKPLLLLIELDANSVFWYKYTIERGENQQKEATYIRLLVGLEMSQLARQDFAALQGTWEQVALEANGISNPPDEYSVPGALTTFSGNHFAVRTTEGVLLLEGTFTLDASVTPKAINYVDSIGPDKWKCLPAIYDLEGDHLVFIAADGGGPRPTIFRTSAGQIMRTFVRRRS